MNLTSIKSPALAATEKYAATFAALDATSVKPVDPTTIALNFAIGHDEDAFAKFVRDEVDGAKLVLSSDARERCMPMFDVENAVKYLGKAPGVTGVEFAPDEFMLSEPGTIHVRTADEAAASHLRGLLRESVELSGYDAPTSISIAPGEG